MQTNTRRAAFDYRLMHISSGDLWAGAEVQMFHLVKSLAAQGCQIRAILFNEGILSNKLRVCGIPVEVLEEKRTTPLSLLTGIYKQLNTYKPDIIHTHGYKENILASIANLAGIKAKSLRTVHGDSEFHVPWWKPHRKFQHFLNRVSANYLQDAIIAVSPALGKTLTQRHPANKIHILQNAIDIQTIIHSASEPPSTRYPHMCFNIACIGRLVPLKRQDILINLMPDLLEQAGCPVHLHLFGDGPEYARLAALIKNQCLEQHVSLHGGVTPLYPHMQQMDLIVMPSDHEGLPMTLLEALALQRPIVAHAVGGIPHVLGEGQFGKLVHMHTAKGYLDAILEILKTPQQIRARAQLGFEHLKKHYAIDTQVHQYDRLYRQLLNTNT